MKTRGKLYGVIVLALLGVVCWALPGMAYVGDKAKRAGQAPAAKPAQPGGGDVKPDLTPARTSPLSHFGDIDLSGAQKQPGPQLSNRATKSLADLLPQGKGLEVPAGPARLDVGSTAMACAGDTCATAALIAAVPFSGTGTTCDCINDYDYACPYTGSTASDAVYVYTPGADQCVDITLCNGSAYDTKLYVYQDTCPGTPVWCNDDACPGYVSELLGLNLTGGSTYYIVVDGYGGSCGNYILDITPCAGPCDITCPPGSTPEGEADCSSVNGGCNSSPPVFSPISCDQDICGTASWDGSIRDTDWYQIVVTADTEFTWTVTAEFDFVIGLVKTSPLGNPDCNTASALDPYALGGACDTASVTACVPPGTYWWFVAPDFNGPTFACGLEYAAHLDCVGCTPPTCVGDTCANAQVIAGLPFNGTGDTCLCVDEYDEICPYDTPGAGDTVYAYTPTVDECVDITLCNGSAYDTKLYVYENVCGTYQSGTYFACNDDECPGFVSELTGLNLTAGNTYYIVIDGYYGACGNYIIDMYPCPPPCDVVCPPSDTPENEPNCGLPDDTVNGGCNSFPPVFSPLACGQEYCGTGAFDGSMRDTDWYQLTVASPTIFTWTVNGEFDSLMGLIETIPAGSGDCADGTGYVNPAGFPTACDPLNVVSDCLPPGTYTFFVAPVFGDLVPCGKEYTAALACESCILPVGACCRGDGSCEDDVYELLCGFPDTWQGEGVLCSSVSCPQPPANDKCPGKKIDCGDTLTGETNVLALDDYNDLGMCTLYNQPGPDVAYELTLPYDADVTVTVFNVTWDPSFYVVADCGNPTDCIGGADNGLTGDPETDTFEALAGTYYIIVDSYYTDGSGTFDITVECVQKAEGACCVGGGCVIDTEDGCVADGGTYAGDNTTCSGSVGGDCNSNGVIDKCDIVNGLADCQPNGILDVCEVPPIGTGPDCQGDGIPDACQLADDKDIVINEGFESGVPPTGWTAVVNNPFTWEIGTYSPWEGVQNAVCFYDETYSGTQDEWLVSSQLTMSGTVTLSGYSEGSVYWGITPYENYDLEAWVIIGTGINDGDDILIGQIDTDTWVSSWVWTPFTYNFTAPGAPFRLAFRYYGYDGAEADIDAITLEGQTGPLPNDCNENQVPDECDPPVCGNNCMEGGVGSTAEECDGTDDDACPGQCYPVGHACACQCPPCAICGNGIVEPGEQCDGGACCTPNCTFQPNTAVCRPSTGPCDPAENCSGSASTCPADIKITSCINGDGCCPAGCNANNDNNCAAACGNNVREGAEECDGTDAAACPAACRADCTCPPTGAIPTASTWGLVVLALLLLAGAKVYFGRRTARMAG